MTYTATIRAPGGIVRRIALISMSLEDAQREARLLAASLQRHVESRSQLANQEKR